MSRNEQRTKAGNGSEKRSEERTPHRSLLVMPYGERLELQFESARLVDCSPHGVGILLGHALPVAGHFLVKLKYRQRTLLVLYAVKHCREADDEPGLYRIGAQYAGEITGPDEAVQAEAIYEALLAT